MSELVADALERPPRERAAWLATVTGGDQGLRAEVESLLAASDEAGAFLERSGPEMTGAASAVVSAARDWFGLLAGRRIGPYEIIRELGHGGMGVVYLAARADSAFEKQVAVKVVRGGTAHAAALARFHDERRILATLDHPNIARLLDGGVTSDGLSYLVMEYVEGVAIDAYCANHNVPLAGRLGLCRQVASAVRYAHQRLVIHRDIKPRNLLITADGTAKLLDFGIAKLLDAEAAIGLTQAGQRAFTVEYASPEQIRGEAMAVTSDVYSIGVLLYHLITGTRPCGAGATADTELMRAICEEPPARPAVAARVGTGFAVSVELEWIVLKALRKEPERRYESVAQLVDDLDRLSSGRPVLAGPDSRRYRARKFATRHRAALGAALLVTASLVGGLLTTLWQARRADQRFNDVRELVRTFMFEMHDEVEKLPGSTTARKLLVSNALTYLDRLAVDAAGDASLQRELAAGYEKMADVLGRPDQPNLGDQAGAIVAYRKAQTARQRLLIVAGDDPEIRRELATTSTKLAKALYLSGDARGGLAEARSAVGIAESLLSTSSSDAARLQVADSYGGEAYLLAVNGDSPASVSRFRQAIALLESLPRTGEVQRHLSVTYSRFGELLCSGAPAPGLIPDTRACVEMFKHSNAIDEALAEAEPANLRHQRSRFVGAIQVGEGLVRLGDRAAAIEYFRRACATGERLAAMDATNLQAQSDAAVACQHLGSSLAQTGGEREALPLLERAAEIFGRVLAADAANLSTRARLAETHEGLGRAHAALGATPSLSPQARAGHWREARSRFDASRAFWSEMREKGMIVGEEAIKPDRLAQEIAKCDAALARLP